MSEDKKVTMRTPFPAHQISKLPKPTKAQTEEVRADYKKGIRCEVCGGWHHPKVVHLDYVGHAALTDRLLDVDPSWTWKPFALDSNGMPAIDSAGGMWIELTVLGVTRMGYGHAGDKTGGDAIKEIIGDALRNAAMRFGAALDLWHKGELHIDEVDPTKGVKHKPTENPLFVPDEEEETFLLSVVDSIIAAKEDIPTATDLFYGQNLDNDQMTWIWNKLGKESALRAAMKKHHSTKEQA